MCCKMPGMLHSLALVWHLAAPVSAAPAATLTDACRPDISFLCEKHKKKGAALKKCLSKSLSALTPKCKAAVKALMPAETTPDTAQLGLEAFKAGVQAAISSHDALAIEALFNTEGATDKQLAELKDLAKNKASDVISDMFWDYVDDKKLSDYTESGVTYRLNCKPVRTLIVNYAGKAQHERDAWPVCAKDGAYYIAKHVPAPKPAKPSK